MSFFNDSSKRIILRIISFNANGIRAAAKKGFFSWLSKQNADVVCIQEVKALQAQLVDPIFAPEGYHAYYFDAEKKGYSGVAIYARQKPDKVTMGFEWPEADAEGRYIQADFGTLSVASLYMPSGTSGPHRQAIKIKFMEKFRVFLEKLKNTKRDFIICGDWNIAHKAIDLKNWKSNQKTSGFLPEERAWMDELFGTHYFMDAFRIINQDPDQYTWWSQRSVTAREKNVGWRIDYQVITANLKDKVRVVQIYKDENFSDHAPLIIEYEL